MLGFVIADGVGAPDLNTIKPCDVSEYTDEKFIPTVDGWVKRK